MIVQKCDKNLAQKSHLKRHMISKHEYIKHFWEKCNSKFNREDQLKRHKDVKHGNVKKKH